MIIYDVIGSVPFEGNTSVVVNSNGKYLKNGLGILDEQGQPHEILAVAMTSSNKTSSINKTTLLVSGKFDSAKLYV